MSPYNRLAILGVHGMLLPACNFELSGFRTLLLIALLASAPTSRADIIHLHNGGTISGVVLSEEEGRLRIRTVLGIVVAPADSVERIETRETAFAEYDERLAAAEEGGADDWASLAEWCLANEMAPLAPRHYQRALALFPDHPAAREALGYVRVGDLWVKADRIAPPRQTASGPAPAVDSEPVPLTEEQLAAEIEKVRRQWRHRVRAIRDQMLHSSLERLRQDGRRQILEIRDPLAIEALTTTLGEGRPAARESLVAALASFPQDEATMDLAAIALLEPEGSIRHQAAIELVRRADPRVIPHLREALHVNHSLIVRNAAELLGLLGAREATPDLINALWTRERKAVEVPVRQYFGRFEDTFHHETSISLNGASYSYRPRLNLPRQAGINTMVGTRLETRDVRVYRTEVLEALKRLTGRNFGFDARAWRDWYEKEQAE